MAAGQRLDGQRLGQAGHALDEEMAARQERHEHPLEQVVLADDDLLDLVQEWLQGQRAGSGLVIHRRGLLRLAWRWLVIGVLVGGQ